MKTRYVAALAAACALLVGIGEAPAAQDTDYLRIINAGMLDFTEMHCRDRYTTNSLGDAEIRTVGQEAWRDDAKLAAFETGQRNVEDMVRRHGVDAVCAELVTEYFPNFFE